MKIEYQVVDDSVWDGAENFNLRVSLAGGGVNSANLSYVVNLPRFSIIDNETEPTELIVSVEPSEINENAGATQVTVTATLNGDAFEDDVDGVIRFYNATAIMGTDVTQNSIQQTNISLVAGATSFTHTFTVTPRNDTIVEGDERLRVNASLGAGAAAIVGGAYLTIVDNEPPVKVVDLATSRFNDGKSVALTWTDPSDGGPADWYEWQIRKPAPAEWSRWERVPSSGVDQINRNSYTVDNVTARIAYTFRVRGVNKFGAGAAVQRGEFRGGG